MNLGSAPECLILRVDLSALVMNLALVGEGEDTGFVLYGETFCLLELISGAPALLTVAPLIGDDLPARGDLSGTPGLSRVGLGAVLVGDAFVGEGEDTAVSLHSPAL